MTPDEALRIAKEAVQYGRDITTKHCRDRMEDRNASAREVKRAILMADRAEQQRNGSWRLYGGKDSEDVPLVPVVDIEAQSIKLVTILD